MSGRMGDGCMYVPVGGRDGGQHDRSDDGHDGHRGDSHHGDRRSAHGALGFLVLVVLAWMAASSVQAEVHSQVSPRCEVWQRELSFARSVAAHDAAAFREHLHRDAVFAASRVKQTRGPDAIVERWAAIIESEVITIEWYPTQTTESAEVPGVVWSAGPALVIEDPRSDKPRYAIGAYHSVWHRGADGNWRVLFDDGVEGKPATSEEANAFRAARRNTCLQPVADAKDQ
jgi:ketosteroid isomerase-like protein